MSLSPEQCRAARGLLNWSQGDLADASGISRSTIKDFEVHRHTLHRSSELLLIEAFRKGGVACLSAESVARGAGVCFCPGGETGE